MHLTKAHISALSLLAAALIYMPCQMPVRGQAPEASNPAAAARPSTVAAPVAPEATSQSARDNLFVNCFLISCASIGAIIAFVVWRSLPPKSKADTKSN